ncbi:MAG: S53 family peptidase, partial [Acidimicrobiales bacterium]
MTGDTRSRTLRRRFAVLAGLALAIPLLGVPPLASVAAAQPKEHAGAGPLVHVGAAPALPGGARLLGAVTAGSEVSAGIVLAPSDPAALAATATAVSDPSSPNYGHYLAQGQFAAHFGPAPAALASVEELVRSAGLHVTGVSADHLLVQFTGSAGRVDATFHTRIMRWRLADGALGTETSSAPSLPESIAKDVTAIIGLDDVVRPHSMLEPTDLRTHEPAAAPTTRATSTAAAGRAAPAAPATRATSTSTPPPGPVACPAAVTDAQGFNGINDQQLAASYGVDGLYDAGDFGAGQTVDIYELEPFAMSDIAAFDTCYFGASHTNQVTVIPVEGGQPAGAGSGEALLDVEDVSAIAPAAHIDVYEAPLTTSGTLDDYIAIVDQDRAHVVSTSWGLCESGAQLGDPGLQQAENEVFEQAAVQGQSVFGPAGDDGSDDCSAGTTPAKPYLSVDDPASQPFVVAVGGTTIYSTPPDAAPGESVWNDGPGGGGTGGGISNTWAMPAWQRHSTVPGVLNRYSTSRGNTYEACRTPASAGGAGLPASALCRELPDVTALADEGTGITVYAAEYGGWTTFGGTSSSTPLWAAMTADVNASTACATTRGIAHDLGFVSPALY